MKLQCLRVRMRTGGGRVSRHFLNLADVLKKRSNVVTRLIPGTELRTRRQRFQRSTHVAQQSSCDCGPRGFPEPKCDRRALSIPAARRRQSHALLEYHATRPITTNHFDAIRLPKSGRHPQATCPEKYFLRSEVFRASRKDKYGDADIAEAIRRGNRLSDDTVRQAFLLQLPITLMSSWIPNQMAKSSRAAA